MNEKLKNLGRALSKEDQKRINGGLIAPGCTDGTQEYCCDIDYTDDTSSQKNFCASSIMDAKRQALQSASNVWGADCELA